MPEICIEHLGSWNLVQTHKSRIRRRRRVFGEEFSV